MMDAYDEGGYEANTSRFKAGVAEQIIADYTHKYSVAKVVVDGDAINVLCM